jgi:hypothetical protein
MEWVFDIFGILMALLPSAIIAQHALYLGLYRRKFLDVNQQPGTKPNLQRAWQVARAREDREFSPKVLFARYGTPASLIAVVVTALFFLLCKLPDNLKPLDQPLWFGSVGAYVYVLLLLTQRNFQRDITSGAAWWCAATLIVGPILAVVFANAWMSAGQPPNQDNPHWAKTSLYFLAGWDRSKKQSQL